MKYLSKLDWGLATSEERNMLVSDLLADDEDGYLSSGLEYMGSGGKKPKFGRSENEAAFELDILASYILMASASDITGSTKNNSRERAVEFDETQSEKRNDVDVLNYYKPTNTVITAADLTDPELTPVAEYYRFKAAVAHERDEAENSKWKYDRIIGELNRDMIEVKESIKRPVRLKGCVSRYEPLHYTECDYTNPKHIRELLSVSPRSIISELGMLTYDLRRMIATATDLTLTEKKVIKSMNNPESGLISYMSASHFSHTLDSIADKLAWAELQREQAG